jgi:hypothetical protein
MSIQLDENEIQIEKIDGFDSVDPIDSILKIEDDKPNRSQQVEQEEEFPEVTKHTVVTSPWSRLLVIAVPSAILFLLIFFFLNGIFNQASHPERKVAESPKTSSTGLEEKDHKDSDVYAKLALDKQSDALSKINKNTVAETKPSVPPTTSPSPTATPTPTPPVRQRHLVALQEAVPPKLLPERTISVPPEPPRSFTPNKFPVPVKSASTQPSVDPSTELEQLRRLGSYGKVAYADASISETVPTPVATSTPTQLQQVSTNIEQSSPNSTLSEIEKIRPRWSNSRQITLVSNSNTEQPSFSPQEEQILQEQRTHYVIEGAFANGILLTSLAKQQTESTHLQAKNDTSTKYIGELTQDLRDNDGQVVLPVGTRLVVEVVDVNSAGFLSAQVVSIIKDNTEYPISPGAIAVLGEAGKPLIAKQFNDQSGKIARNDLKIAIASGAGKVGEILNQSNSSSSVVSSVGGTFSSNVISNTKRNILGAFLQGAGTKLSDSIGRRAETTNQQILARPKVWYVRQGTKVRFVVNRTLEWP